MSWKDYIEKMKKELIGKNVVFCGETYKIVEVDYNGAIRINLPTEFTKTTAIGLPGEFNIFD